MPKSFTDELRDLRRGALVADLTDKMAALVLEVAATGKPGKLTLELTVKRASRGSSALTVADKTTVKMPDANMDSETLMFASPEGSLLTEDPRQARLDLKAVAVATPTELKTAPEPERLNHGQ